MPVDAHSAARSRRSDVLCALRREEILTAAIKLFGRKGFDATRAEDIATAAKLAKGTIYLYFKSKEEIYSAAVSQAIAALQEEITGRSAGASGFREKLSTAIYIRLEFWREHEGIYRLLLTVGRTPRLRRQTNEVLRSAHSSLLAIFTESVAAGEIEPADFIPLAWAALDLVRGATERRMDKQSDTSPQEDAEWILSCLLEQVSFLDAPS